MALVKRYVTLECGVKNLFLLKTAGLTKTECKEIASAFEGRLVDNIPCRLHESSSVQKTTQIKIPCDCAHDIEFNQYYGQKGKHITMFINFLVQKGFVYKSLTSTKHLHMCLLEK